MAAYVAGNGTSRCSVNLVSVKKQGKLYGCNSIYKEITPDVLVATDEGQSHAIQLTGYALHHEFHTRKPYCDKGARQLKLPHANWSSGPNAVQLAVIDGHTEIFLFGFDFGGITDVFNNVFASHEFYKKVGDDATYGGNWYNQIETIVRHGKKIKFTVVIGTQTDTSYTDSLKELENVEIMPLSEFLIHINNV